MGVQSGPRRSRRDRFPRRAAHHISTRRGRRSSAHGARSRAMRCARTASWGPAGPAGRPCVRAAGRDAWSLARCDAPRSSPAPAVPSRNRIRHTRMHGDSHARMASPGRLHQHASPAVDADIRKRGRFRRSVGVRSCGIHLLPAHTLLRSARHVNPRDYGTLWDAATQNTRLLERSVTLTHATPAAAPETDDPRRSPLKLGQDRSLEWHGRRISRTGKPAAACVSQPPATCDHLTGTRSGRRKRRDTPNRLAHATSRRRHGKLRHGATRRAAGEWSSCARGGSVAGDVWLEVVAEPHP